MSPVHAMHNYSHLHYQAGKQEKSWDNSHHYSNNLHRARSTSQHLTYLDIFFQIRAEKPYYMADPEVDSLVSYTNTSRQLNISPVLPREIFLMFFHATLSRAGLLTGIGKNSNENAYLHHDKTKKGKGKEIVPVTLYGWKMEKHFEYF